MKSTLKIRTRPDSYRDYVAVENLFNTHEIFIKVPVFPIATKEFIAIIDFSIMLKHDV